jgi:malonyl-CoA/methylmalonyl-CoA synthetase
MKSENFYDLIAERLEGHLDDIYLETPAGEHYSYSQLEAESARYAQLYMQLGLQSGDRVAVQTEKSASALFAYLGCLRAGLVYLPLNPAYRDLEIEYFLENAEPGLVICSPERLAAVKALATKRRVAHVLTLDASGRGTLHEAARACPAVFSTAAAGGDEVAVILYTSGTTGRPKGAMITHRNLAANALALHKAWGWQPGDVLLHALPIFHIHGLFVACHCAMLNASKILFLPKFDVAAVMRALPQATVFMGVPTYYTRLLAEPAFGSDVCRNMRLFTCGSAPLLPQTFREFHERTGHTILERYGMTETGMNTSNPLDGPRLPGTVGPPLPGVAVRVVDATGNDVANGEVGELLVKGPNVFKGYWRMPEKTVEEFTGNGFFRTGDLARRDDNGYVSIVGRAKDLIISGGLNIYPKEIEGYLDKLEGVQESAVIGVPHPDFGEAVVAVLVARPGNEDLRESDVIAALKPLIASFKVPKRVFVVPELPRNTMGKVQKNLLREKHLGLFAKP